MIFFTPMPHKKLFRVISLGIVCFILLSTAIGAIRSLIVSHDKPSNQPTFAEVNTELPKEESLSEKNTDLIAEPSSYPVHKSIGWELLWVGENTTSKQNGTIKKTSVWNDTWSTSFGGSDDPTLRNGPLPKNFIPQENPFYISLPYNDFIRSQRKQEALEIIPWANSKKWKKNESLCKNRWVRIMRGTKIVYGQWQDAGPTYEDDGAYVFLGSAPKNTLTGRAGIGISPAIRDSLGLETRHTIDWQFVPEQDVPEGPWKNIITRSPLLWDDTNEKQPR